MLCCDVCTQMCSEEQLLALIHEGGLISKLKGCMNQKGAHMRSPWGPDMTIYKLTQVWTDKARGLSRELYKHIEGEGVSGGGVRSRLVWLIFSYCCPSR